MIHFSFSGLTLLLITSRHQTEKVEEFCTDMVTHVSDCVLCEWLWEMNVCWTASVILGPRSARAQKPLRFSGPRLSLSQLSVTPDDFHLLAESTGVKSLSRNGHLLMATWHMKWLLLCDSLGVRQSGSRPATVSSFDCQTPVRFR